MILRQSKGISALQALISTAVVTGIALTTLANFSNIQKNQNRSAASASRISIATVLSFNASNPLSLYLSSEYSSNTLANHQMRACMCGETTCTPGSSSEFNLLDVSSVIIAGTDSDRRKFNLLGNYCQNETCVFDAATRFTCQGSNCGTYNTSAGNPVFRIDYRLYLTNDIKSRNGEYSYLKDTEEFVEVPVSAIKQYGLINDVCVSGTSVTANYGLSSGGQSVTISGTGLQKVTQVLFDNSPCSISTQGKKSITCITPPHADGYVNVTLRYANNQSYVLNNAYQYYTPPPPPPPEPPPSPSMCYGTWSRAAVFGPCSGTPSGSCAPCGMVTEACGGWFSCNPY